MICSPKARTSASGGAKVRAGHQVELPHPVPRHLMDAVNAVLRRSDQAHGVAQLAVDLVADEPGQVDGLFPVGRVPQVGIDVPHGLGYFVTGVFPGRNEGASWGRPT